MRRSAQIAILSLFLTAAASADVVTLSLIDVYSGTDISYKGPYLIATFTDTAAGVQLVMSTAGLNSNQFVSDWVFNLNPTMSAGSLAFTPSTGITTGTNFYQADGDGRYDIRFSFPTNGTSRFWGGTQREYLITGTGLTAHDFNYLSTPPPGVPADYKGPYTSAAHLQGGGVQAWVGAPEPASYPLYGGIMAALCLGIWQRIRSRRR